MAEKLDSAFRRIDQGEHHPDRCALAGSVWPQKSKNVAALNLEVETLHGPALLKTLSEVLSPEDDF